MTIKPKCMCGQSIRIEVSTVTPTVHDRTCPRCKAKWRIIASPLPRPKDEGILAVHLVELTCTRDGKPIRRVRCYEKRN